MNVLAAIVLALQLVSATITGVQQVRAAVAVRPTIAPQIPPPQPIAQQPGDDVRYWFDQQLGTWVCSKNGVLYAWTPPR